MHAIYDRWLKMWAPCDVSLEEDIEITGKG